MEITRVVAAVTLTLVSCLNFPENTPAFPLEAPDDPALKIEAPAQTPEGNSSIQLYKASELLRRSDLTVLTVPRDPAYAANPEWKNRPLTYAAVPFASLFEGIAIPEDATLQYQCLDGFSGAISKSRALNRSEKGAIAYLAIERPAQPWPPIKPDSPATPGPFYLIWKNPERSSIAREEWPFQLSAIEIKASLESRFPGIVPDRQAVRASDPVMRGYKLFTTNCFSCHLMNGQGESEVGPDLNLPFGPTEYFQDRYLRLFIRNPQSVRHWPEGRMSEFSPEALSDSQIDELLKYFRYMSSRKSSPSQSHHPRGPSPSR